jgi:hypothetical protein
MGPMVRVLSTMMTSNSSIKSIPIWVWIVPSVALVVATARLPYGYYTFTRIRDLRRSFLDCVDRVQQSHTIPDLVLIIVAVVFNPVRRSIG